MSTAHSFPNIRRCSTGFVLATVLMASAVGAQINAVNQPAQGEVPPVDLAKVKVSDFADDELDLPYYLANFYRVANSVPLEGEQRGWITASVWRGNANQQTYNARVLESQLSLAYFYCTKRPWNPYHAHWAVRVRLEAMLERWCNMQSPDGKFSEYAEGRWGLAPTAFATKFTSGTLRLLAKGPPIDAKLHERVKQAQRKAILITLRDQGFWEHGRKYSNQFGNVWAGGLAWLGLFPDDKEVRAELLKRMKEAASEMQSPAGYFYERSGPDWGYNLSTHHSNLHVAWHYARGTEFEPFVVNETRHFYDWLAWNAGIEPDGSGFVLNRAIETRQRRPWVGIFDGPQARNFSGIPQAEAVELARAFLPNREQETSTLQRLRADLEQSWPEMPQWREGDFRSYTPYAFLHRDLTQWLPTAQQQADARAKLPYWRDGSYAHLRADNRHSVHFLYVRRPNYYVAFNGGEQLEASQRYGLGLLWSPGIGALVQSQTSSDDVWGTGKVGGDVPYEAGNLNAHIELAGKPIQPNPGTRDLGAGELTINYALGESGRKTIHFEDDRIRVQATHSGNFHESIPLLVREVDHALVEQNRVVLERGGKVVLTIEFDPTASAELLNARMQIGPYRVVTARLKAADKLTYAVKVTPR